MPINQVISTISRYIIVTNNLIVKHPVGRSYYNKYHTVNTYTYHSLRLRI